MLELDITTIHETIDRDRAAFVEETYTRGDSLVAFREYYKGQQPNTLTEAQAAILEGVNVHNSADNVCAQIVDEGAARLTLLLPDVQANEGSTEESAERVKSWLETELWIKNHLPKRADETHRSAIRDRDFCLLPSWQVGTPGRIVLYAEPWWDGASGVYIQYDDREQPLYAVKEWQETIEKNPVKRRDVWTDDTIYRYVGQGGGSWSPYRRDDDAPGTNGVIPWTSPLTGKPLHIPYAHFRCDKSALAGGMLGNQDKLNDLGYAVNATWRLTAFQMYWATAAAAEGAVTEVGPAIWKFFDAKEARTGVYPAGDIGQMLAARDSHLQRIASASNMPTHSFSGKWPSGEALLRAELSAVNAALARAEQFKPAWATLFHRATEIANAFGKVGLDENALIVAKYDSVDKLDDLKKFMAVRELFTAAQQAVASGVPIEIFMEHYSDWTPAQLENLKAALKREAQDAEQQEEAELDRMMRLADREKKNGSRIPA